MRYFGTVAEMDSVCLQAMIEAWVRHHFRGASAVALGAACPRGARRAGVMLAVLACAGVCSSVRGAPFEVNRVDAGGVPGQSVGNPMTWSPANAAYNPATGGNFPPHTNAIAGSALVQWDSYVAIDPAGASQAPSCSTQSCGYTALGPTSLVNPPATPTTPFSLGSLGGVWFNNASAPNAGFIRSDEYRPGDAFNDPLTLFIAQITLRPGTSPPTTAGVAVNIRDFGTANPLGETGLLRFGIENATTNGGRWGQPYYLGLRARPARGLTGAFVGATSYEIYVVAVPGPGAAGLLGLAGFMSVRRRRVLNAGVAACAALGATGAAQGAGQPFQVNTIDAGGIPGGSLGNPITWTGGAAFNPATGGNSPPAQQSIAGNAALQFDSYVAIDPIGPSRPNINPVEPPDDYTALGPSSIIFPTATPTTPFGSSSLSGVWFNAGANGGWIASGPAPQEPLPGSQQMFIAQITLRAGSSEPTTQGLLVNIRDFGTVSTTGELGELRFGIQNASNNGGKWGQSYYLSSRSRPADGLTGSFVGAVSHAIFVIAIPAPGAAGMLSIAGLAASRRRR
ncbi:MAG: hypothetical protein ACKVZJ_10540 [Phycisphaerales bacterium]